MFKSKEKITTHKIDTLISHKTVIRGDIHFSGGLHIDGVVEGNIIADGASNTTLVVGDKGRIEGEVHVPEVVVSGVIVGDLFASQKVELDATATISGNVYYNLIRMVMGAKVNGNLIHRSDQSCLSNQSNTVYIEQPTNESVDAESQKELA